jgi:hypothetical protein
LVVFQLCCDIWSIFYYLGVGPSVHRSPRRLLVVCLANMFFYLPIYASFVFCHFYVFALLHFCCTYLVMFRFAQHILCSVYYQFFDHHCSFHCLSLIEIIGSTRLQRPHVLVRLRRSGFFGTWNGKGFFQVPLSIMSPAWRRGSKGRLIWISRSTYTPPMPCTATTLAMSAFEIHRALT